MGIDQGERSNSVRCHDINSSPKYGVTVVCYLLCVRDTACEDLEVVGGSLGAAEYEPEAAIPPLEAVFADLFGEQHSFNLKGSANN